MLLSSAVETSTGAKSPPLRLRLSSQAKGKLPRFEEARAHHHLHHRLPSFLLLLPPILPFSFLPNSLEKLAQLVPHNHSLFKSSPILPAACGSCAHNIMLEIPPAAKHASVVVLGYEHAAFDNGTGFNNLFFRCHCSTNHNALLSVAAGEGHSGERKMLQNLKLRWLCPCSSLYFPTVSSRIRICCRLL